MTFVKLMFAYCIFLIAPLRADTFTDLLNRQSFENLPPDISFMIIDLKYKPGSLKICEFGEGFLSGFVGHSMLYGPGVVHAAVLEFLQSFEKPLIQYTDKIVLERPRVNVMSLDALRVNKHKNIAPSSIAEVDSIAVAYGRKDFFEAYQAAGLLKTGVLAVDYATRPFALHKGYMHMLFQGDKLVEHYRPACQIVKREYRPDLAASIISTIPAQAYVIKPLNSWKGKGIIIVESQDLDAKLKAILPSENTIIDHSVDYWGSTAAGYFIIESLEHSINLKRGKDFFDPTMRVILGLSYDNGEVGMTILGAYWKMPKVSIHSRRSVLADRYISHILPKDKRSSARVSPAILTGVERELKQFMPHVYKKMIMISHQPELLSLLRVYDC